MTIQFVPFRFQCVLFSISSKLCLLCCRFQNGRGWHLTSFQSLFICLICIGEIICGDSQKKRTTKSRKERTLEIFKTTMMRIYYVKESYRKFVGNGGVAVHYELGAMASIEERNTSLILIYWSVDRRRSKTLENWWW